VERFPKQGEEIRVERIIGVPGGKGANIAVASARILGKEIVVLFGALGSDSVGREQLKLLRKAGIITDLIQFVSEASGRAFIIVDSSNGNNCVLTFKRANDALNYEMINNNKNLLRHVRNSSLVTVVDPPIEVAEILISLAAEEEKIVVWAPGLLSSIGIEKLMAISEKVNYIILNESECSILTGVTNPLSAYRILQKKIEGKETKIVITRGHNGCVLIRTEDIISIPTMNPLEFGLKIVNTVGSGDAFIGVFSAFKILGYDDIESLSMANIEGTIKATREETRASPPINEVRDYAKSVRIEYEAIF